MTLNDVDLLERLAVQESRESFLAFRRYIRPKLIVGWWQRELAAVLQSFASDLSAGKRPKLVIEAPPQHGKSLSVVDFAAWASGLNPDIRTIYTSFSERLGVGANLACQRIMSSHKYRKAFPGITIGGSATSSRNRSVIEFVGHSGYFRNTTVRGSITGESLDLGIIDDPIKGREEAGSKALRDKTWDWFTDDFFTRFSENAGMLVILTRWHIDDTVGRMRGIMGDNLRVMSYPAIAEHDERHRKAGDPLFPEHKSLQFLLERKATMPSTSWEALYQQNPQVIGGEIIKVANFGRYTIPPVIKHRNIYADTAQKTAERNDYSVFACWGKGDDGKVYLLDMIRGKWEAPELERRAIAFWAKNKAAQEPGALRHMKIEDKASGTGLIQKLKSQAHIPVTGIQRSKDKYTRLLDVLGYIESGYVMLPDGAPFVSDFMAECEAFSADDSHMHDDQVDTMIDAIQDMLATQPMPDIKFKFAF